MQTTLPHAPWHDIPDYIGLQPDAWVSSLLPQDALLQRVFVSC